MNDVSSTQMRKIRKYSGYARPVCLVVAVLCVLCAGFLSFILLREFLAGDLGLKAGAERLGGITATSWLLAGGCVGFLFWGAIAWLLRRMFDNFSRGEIFHAANVREMRRIASVMLLIAVKGLGINHEATELRRDAELVV